MDNDADNTNGRPDVSASERATGFMPIGCGGTGLESLQTYANAYRRDHHPFPMFSVLVDTEEADPPFVDDVVPIGIETERLEAIIADPAAYGPVTEAVVEHYLHYLGDEAAIDYGSGTLRFLTQMCAEVHLSEIVQKLKDAVLSLKKMGARTIVPVLISSTGGGAGSALVTIFGKLFSDPYFIKWVTTGLNRHILKKPVAFVSEPFALAALHSKTQANRILGNAYAFRVETAYLEARHAFQLMFHQSPANDDGTVLDSPDEIYKGLGLAAYQFCRNMHYIKARFADTVENAKLFSRYLGHDVPEAFVPKDSQPSFASELRPRSHYPFISLANGDHRGE